MTTALRLVFVAGVLSLLAWLVDPRALIARLQSAEPLPVLAALVLVQCQIVASAERWRLTATALGQPLSRGRAVTEYYVASLLNQLLPGGVSGDVVRVWRNRGDARNAQAWAVPARAIMIERLAGQVVLGVVASAGLLVWVLGDGGAIPGAGVLLAGVGMALALMALAAAGLARWAPRRLARFAAGFGPAIRVAWLGPGKLWRQLLWSLAIVASYLAAFALASAAIGAPLAPLAVVALVPLVLLTMLLPISVAGWGAREAAAAALWPLAGAASADGMAASVLYGLVSLVGALPGALLIARRRVHAGAGRQA